MNYQHLFEQVMEQFNKIKTLILPLFTQDRKATIEEPKKKEQEREIQREPIKKRSSFER